MKENEFGRSEATVKAGSRDARDAVRRFDPRQQDATSDRTRLWTVKKKKKTDIHMARMGGRCRCINLLTCLPRFS
ncbi:hypothetical protein AMELA_G00132700 [Ameiurus melas]|uniref:Uncharacterized protein n=1 Tax=Ameiurus melas TaxID=219545 RepID=A0A7J6AIS6_AMEME|nr:hypothetical protein AMELA_G00132700 [Ameiurus melas]